MILITHYQWLNSIRPKILECAGPNYPYLDIRWDEDDCLVYATSTGKIFFDSEADEIVFRLKYMGD